MDEFWLSYEYQKGERTEDEGDDDALIKKMVAERYKDKPQVKISEPEKKEKIPGRPSTENRIL